MDSQAEELKTCILDENTLHNDENQKKVNKKEKSQKKENKEPMEESDNMGNDEKYIKLISMGYKNKASMGALKFAKFDIKLALRYLAMWGYQARRECEGYVGSMKQCQHLLFIKRTLHASDEKLDIGSTLNSFHHLLLEHDSDEEFEEIYHILGECNLLKCNKFRRNYRERAKEQKSKNETQAIEASYIDDIVDKIHCYFQHGYDIGFRLDSNERKLIKTIVVEEKYDDKQYLMNDQYMRLFQILRSKQKKRQSACIELNKRANKYNQLFSNYNYKTYSFGYRFNYGSDETVDLTSNKTQTQRISIIILPKYSSLKEEMISNDIATLTKEQFNNEYTKAQHHLTSKYCVETFGSAFSMKHLLSLMVYCNYYNFQYEFSKTYRNNKGEDHNNYFFMGRYLKEAVHIFGAATLYSTVYHGIGQKMVFPSYTLGVGPQFHHNQGILIHCPLSTTSSFFVAANFTADNNGMIVEFEGALRSKCKYFSVAWCSDYPNESEYLFIQNNTNDTALIMTNIVDVTSCFEYKYIIGVLYQIEQFTNPRGTIEFETSDTVNVLLEAIISDRFSKHNAVNMDDYARCICDTFFHNKTNFDMVYDEKSADNWTTSKERICIYMNQLFFSSDIGFIDLDVLFKLFPSINDIKVSNVNLSEKIMEYILAFFATTTSNMKKIQVISKRRSKLSIERAINEYTQLFQQQGIYICSTFADSIFKRRIYFVFDKELFDELQNYLRQKGRNIASAWHQPVKIVDSRNRTT
eukprot:539460_1